MRRDRLKVEHFSVEFFIWKQSKEIHGEQRLQRRGPGLSPRQALGRKEGASRVSPLLLPQLCRP